MTDWLEKLKSVAAGRTAGRWEKRAWAGVAIPEPNPPFYLKQVADCFQRPDDAEFIATAANCFDELLHCVDMFEEYVEFYMPDDDKKRISQQALAALAAKVGVDERSEVKGGGV